MADCVGEWAFCEGGNRARYGLLRFPGRLDGGIPVGVASLADAWAASLADAGVVSLAGAGVASLVIVGVASLAVAGVVSQADLAGGVTVLGGIPGRCWGGIPG